jgi:hypothetical protein
MINESMRQILHDLHPAQAGASAGFLIRQAYAADYTAGYFKRYGPAAKSFAIRRPPLVEDIFRVYHHGYERRS